MAFYAPVIEFCLNLACWSPDTMNGCISASNSIWKLRLLALECGPLDKVVPVNVQIVSYKDYWDDADCTFTDAQ